MKVRRARVPSCVVFAATMTMACEVDAGLTSPSTTAVALQTIVVLGDSLATSPTRSESFPAVLQARLEARNLPWRMTNAGVRGDTTGGGLRRLDQALEDKPSILIVALGANDGLRGVEPALIGRNLSEIIERSQARDVKVLLCGMETPPLRGWSYSLAFHRIFPDLALKYNIPLVPFLLDGVALNPDMNGNDLIHPNAAGARLIADTVWPYLEPLVTVSVQRVATSPM